MLGRRAAVGPRPPPPLAGTGADVAGAGARRRRREELEGDGDGLAAAGKVSQSLDFLLPVVFAALVLVVGTEEGGFREVLAGGPDPALVLFWGFGLFWFGMFF